MFGLGIGEIILIAIIAIVLFGKEDLPKNLRKVAKGMNEFKKVASDAQRSWMEVKDDVTRTIMHADLDKEIRNSGAPVRSSMTENSGSVAPVALHHEHNESNEVGTSDALVAALPLVVAAPGAVHRGQEILLDDHSHNHHEERREEPASSPNNPQKSTT